MEGYNLITILGPTAGGKTRIAAHIAHRLKGEVISADSRQVYKHMTIGTGKDYEDYSINDTRIPHHLIDIREPGEKYNVFEYQQDFYKVFRDIRERGKMPVLCGGSGLYLEAVLDGYKMLKVPEDKKLREELESKSLQELSSILAGYKSLHNLTDIDTKKRAIRAIEIARFQQEHQTDPGTQPEIHCLLVGIRYDRRTQKDRISQRLHHRLQHGMIEEVQKLMDMGLSDKDLVYYGLEYKYITKYLIGELEYLDMVEKLGTAIHQFSKRQMTWFRRMERNGKTIHWIDVELPLEEKVNAVLHLFREQG